MASNSKKRRRVLGASCILAALIIASSSFAWFTSKDEVTNRLSASANYGVSIAEDFTPPENWLPGQKVDKNVGVVNTGNVDAFVRTWLEGEMNVLAEKRDTQKWDSTNNKFTDSVNSKETLDLTSVVGASDAIDNLTLETDTALKENDLTYYYMEGTDKDSKVSLKELRQDTYLNPNSPVTPVASPEGYSDVMAVQAGGELVYTSTTSDTFEFTFTPNQTQTITSAGYDSGTPAVHTGGTTYDINGGTTYTVKVGTAPASGDDIKVDNTANSETINVKDLDTFYKYINNNIDTNTFKPKTTGLYIFKRNTDSTANQYPDYEFTGYYYVAKTTDNGAEGKFFALQYENDESLRSDYVLEKDTYTVIRDNTGKVTFVPSRTDGTYTISGTGYDATFVDGRYYDASTGLELTGGAWTATDAEANKVTLFTAQKQVVENSALTWTYALNDETAAPADRTSVKYGDKTYVYDATGRKWTENGSDVTDADTIATLKAMASRNGKEVENNGVVYTYDASTDTWTASDSSTVDPTLKARLDAAAASNATLTASWVGVDGNAATAADNISVIVNLTNIGTDAEKWTAITSDDSDATKQRTFYYNNDVEEGATTAKLVDSVELSKDTKKNAYIAFDFDLNVFMESMQVTVDDNGKEAYESVTSWGPTGTSNTGATGANVASTQTGSEIENIAWTYSAT